MKREVYTPGYAAPALQFMRQRTLATHGAFAQGLFRPGAQVLDLGCGPGTITLDIARSLLPGGSVTAVDRNASQFRQAARQARVEKLPVRFQRMDAYALKLEPQSCDVVFSHALFEHLQHPDRVLEQVRTILRRGGRVALRCPDWGGFVLHPSTPALRRAIRARQTLQRRNGGDVFAGRKLGPWLRAAGFGSVQISASYEIYDAVTPIVEHLATQLTAAGMPQQAGAVRQWGREPDVLFAQAWFEAVGVKH